MTVREMHIEVEQATQQVAANRGRKWLPEEIDWILNKMQNRYIASCLRPREDGSGGFELDTAGADKIRKLLVRTTTPLKAFIEGDERYKVHLPAEYQYLISDWSYTKDLCGAAVPAADSITQFISRIPHPLTDKGSSPFYETLEYDLFGSTINIPSDLPAGHEYTGFLEKSDISFLTHYLLNKFKTLYWENFDGYNHPKHFIYIVYGSSLSGGASIIMDGDTYTAATTISRVLTYHSGTGVRHNNRLCGSDIIPSLNESAYYKSSHYSPISELEGNNLYIYRDNSYIVTGIGMLYVRKPQPISLSLNSDCELTGEAVHQAICDLASEYLKGTTENQLGKAMKTEDITQRVTL